MNEREQALAQIVALAERHGLDHRDVRRALATRRAGASGGRPSVLARLFATVGGTLVLAGLGVFIGTLWDEMNSLERIVATLGSGLAALVLAYLASLTPGRERLVTPLFLVAVLAQPSGLVVALRELSAAGDEPFAGLALSAAMALQCVLFFTRVRRASVLFCTLVFASVALWSALDLLGLEEELVGLVVGTALLLVTVAIARSEHEWITPFWYGASSLLIMGSWFETVRGSLGEITEVALVAGCVYLSTLLRSRTLLATGTLGLLLYIGYFSGRHFADSIGWPLLLILLGGTMMALGTAAVRIHRRYIKSAA